VVKNVTGYDLGKLFTGSLGTLGVIESGWLRLRPLPATTILLSGESGSGPEACELGLAAARLGSARAVAVTRRDEASDCGWKVTVELAGDAQSVEVDRQVLAARADLSEDAAALAAVRALQNEVPKPAGARFRLALLATELPAAVTRLADGGAAILAYPGLGLVYAGVALPERPDERAAEEAFRIVETAASDGRAAGPIRCESAPTWAKHDRDVFGATGGTLRLIRELKRRYDPRSVLNPGRFAGRT
jgi:glycolate oxidase FAD binding subunit